MVPIWIKAHLALVSRPMLPCMDQIGLRYRVATRLERLHRRLQRWQGRAIAFMSGMIINMLLNAATNPGSLLAVVRQVYNVGRASGILAWGFTVAVVALVGVPPLLESYTRRWNWLSVLSQTFAQARDPQLTWIDRSTLVWGTEVMLQSPPDLRRGWAADAVELAISHSGFNLPDEHTAAYEEFVTSQNTIDPQRLTARAPKYGLSRNPSSFSDNPSLRLEIKETEYGKILYYKDKVAPDDAQRAALVRTAMDDRRIAFPNNLCLHAVVTTSDGKLLLTRRSTKVEYFPGRWSCSIEEQLAARDLEPDDGAIMRRWVTRALTEELGLRDRTLHDSYHDDAVILGVMLEASILNCGLIGLVSLDCDSFALAQILRTHPRTDYEFDEFAFIDWHDLAQELVNPTREYHPTSGIRMLTTGIAHFGPLAFIERLVDARAKSGRRAIKNAATPGTHEQVETVAPNSSIKPVSPDVAPASCDDAERSLKAPDDRAL